MKPRGACKGNSRGGHARLVGCARKAEKGNDAYVSIHELTKNGKTYLVGNRLLSSLLGRARALAGPGIGVLRESVNRRDVSQPSDLESNGSTGSTTRHGSIRPMVPFWLCGTAESANLHI